MLKCFKANYSEVIEANFLITSFPVLRKSLDRLKKIHNENILHMEDEAREKIISIFKKL